MTELPIAPVRWGILGAGRVADGFASDLRRTPGCELVAVASNRPDAGAAFARRHEVTRVHDRYEALADDTAVDVVYVATSNDRHADDAVLCLRHGKAVLCEKPFTIDAASARRVVEEARAQGVFCMEAMWMRFVPAMQRIAQLVQDGAIGAVHTVFADFSHPVAVDPGSRFFDPARGGGAVLDLGVYTLSLAQLLLGEPSSVAGRLAFGGTGVDEHAEVVLGYEGGASAVLSSSLRATGPNEAVIAGELATIRVRGPICAPTSFVIEPVRPIDTSAGPSDDRLRRLLTDHRAGRRAMQMVRAARALRSRRSGRVQLPIVGNGYGYEADEVARCIRAGRTESDVMPLDASVNVIALVDRLRTELSS